MRTVLILCSVFIMANATLAQTPAVDKLFDKYAYQDGFTTVYITKHMFELFAEKNMAKNESEAMQKAIAGLESIRILTVEDSLANSRVNFMDEIGKEIPFNEYKTLMVVKESDQDLRMMVKEKNGIITEFLMVGGGDDNLLINIVGEIDLESLAQISEAIDLDEIQEIQGLQ